MSSKKTHLFLFVLIFLLSGFSNLTLFAQVDFTSSNLPIIIIDTNGQQIPYDDPRIIADMGAIDNGSGIRNNISDSLNNYHGKISIEIRGSSSAGWAKKSYGIETQNADGTNNNVPLLGLPPENDWVLYAPYYDRSLIRNVLTLRLMREMGWYATRTRFCELILNGVYQGVYVLMEKIKRDKSRVEISKLNPDEISGDDLTGGYIIKIDKEPEKPGFNSNYSPFPFAQAHIRYQFHYPKAGDIVAQQMSYIESFIDQFETAMDGEQFADPQNGYKKFLNAWSFIDYLLLNELTRNVDGYRLSAFFYKDKDSKGGKLVAGPAWDYNLSCGNSGYYDSWKIDGWQIVYFSEDNDFHRYDRFFVPFWWKKLFNEADFFKQTCARWSQLRNTILSDKRIAGKISAYSDTLSESQSRNFQIWGGPGESLIGSWFPPDFPIAHLRTHQDELDYIQDWLVQRMAWMDENLPETTGLIEEKKNIAAEFILEQNYPNPFNNFTLIKYQLPEAGPVELTVYDVLGHRIHSLVSKLQKAGPYQLNWNASDISSGVYFLELRSGNSYRKVRKLVLIK